MTKLSRTLIVAAFSFALTSPAWSDYSGPSSGGGGGGAATIADGADTAEGTTTDPAYTTGAGTVVALLKGLYAKLAGSLSVTGTFWQATQPVSAASLPLPTGSSTSALQTTGNTSLASIATNTAAPTAQGVTASGSSLTENPLANGGKAQSSETAVTNGQKVSLLLDLVGKLVTSPYANRENFLNCAVTDNANTATTCTGMGAQGASVKIYITDLCLTRSDAGTTAISATLNDSATTILDLPNSGGGGGVCKAYNVPLQVAANTAFQVTMSSATTSVHISASGYKGY